MTVDLVRQGIRAQESGGEANPYQAHNWNAAQGLGAHGGYQYIDTTWQEESASMAVRTGDRRALAYTRASDAPADVQDAVMVNELERRIADPRFQDDWERVIAAHFDGESAVVLGPKDHWDVKPTDQTGSPTPYNPDISVYVAGVLAHIKEIT